MFRSATRQELFVLIILSVRLGAQDAGEVYSQDIKAPDFLASWIEPLFKPGPSGLYLTGWTSGLVPADTTDEQAEELPPELHLSARQASQVMRHFPAMLKLNLTPLKRAVLVDPQSHLISIALEHDQTPVSLPSTTSLVSYITRRVSYNVQTLARDKLSAALISSEAAALNRTRSIELLGADIGGQRVSLKVAGNVTINGGVKFKEQEKSVTNFRAGSNWDLDVNQTQRFDITGSVGDRIDVTIHQDSENIFEWENAMKIAYKGDEDEILQTIDAGNISLSLPGTQFATGGSGSSKGLFGIKAVSKLGPLNITTIASIERSQKSTKSNQLSEALVIQDRLYLRNKYFFIDTEFRRRYYPLTKDGRHTVFGDRVIKQLEVYLSSSRIAQVNLADTYTGSAFINPADSATALDVVEGQFRRLELNVDYVPNYELGVIRMTSSAQNDDIIAVAYSLGSATGAAYDSIGSVGFVKTGGDDRIVLKLIKDRGQSASSPTWQLEFKNVYSLGGININPEGFDVKIFDIQATGGRTDRLGNETFLKIFGLDQRSNSDQQGPPDDLVDTYNFAIVKLALGELHFPALLPFAYSSVPGLATSDTVILEVYDKELEDLNGNFVFEDGEDLNNDGKWDVPDQYYAPLRPISARFEIEVQQSSAGKSVYNLGFNMVPGSETVKINGQTLVEGKDYEIDLFSNTLTILRMEDYINPDVTIDYEENSLVSFDKKVMMGIRAQMDLGESSFLGITGLYYNQSIIDERVDVGSEPIRNMLWDVNGRLRRDAPMLTRLIDRLPFIETDAASSFNIEGEIAQVLPNPNPLGTGYVDDFEAAKRVSSPSLQYRSWKQSSPPVGKRLHQRRKMAWWNPFQDKSVQDIWPQRETSIRANNLTTTILILDAFFDRFNELPTDSMWAGITYPLFAGEYDQSQTKFFEVWLNGFQGRLHIDIGDISEDINGNGVIDTEDEKLPGTTEGNSLLDEGEDVGLDGCTDEFEDGTGGCFGIDDDRDGRTDEEIFNGIDDDGDGRIDEDLGARPALADINDPNGDNWKNSSSNRSNDFINGTEGNSQSADGSRPDTEDLNGTGSFAPDVKNDYFTVSFSLDPLHADTSFVGGSTFNENGSPTGWRLFRIPLSEFQPEGRSTVTWDNVKNLRLWVDKLGGARFDSRLTSQIQIAQIEFVGNEWEEIGIATIGSDIFSVVDSTLNLAVSVVNTEDNQDYSSPPKVDGVFDRLNGIRLREQSLSLDFSVIGLPPRTKGALSKEIVNRTNDATFLAYRTMEMFVYGDAQDVGEPLMTPELTYYQFWLRLGLGKASGESYYELRKSLYPGWDDRNHFDIDMVALAGLKIAEPDTIIVIDADSLPAYILDDDMLVIIRGDPSVDRIGRYTVGVTNIHPTRSIYGRAFIDELRLTGVEKEKGIAVRLSGSLNLADLMTTSFSYVRTDANFHNIQQKIARGPTTRETFRSNLLLNPHQLLPKSWGIRTPVSMNYTRSINSPKYLPGRDIRAGDLRSAPDSVQQRSETVAVKVSFGKSARSRFWVMRQTLDRLTGGVTYQVKDQSNKEILSLEEQSITTNLSYPIKFSDENYIKPFKIIEKIPWLGDKLKDTRIYYTPTSLQVSGTVSEVISNKVVRAQRDTTLERYNFNLKRSAAAKYRITDNLSLDYSRNANSSLDDLRFQKIDALKQFETGLDKQISEQYSAKFSPEIFSWLKPNISYQSQYQWNKVNPIDEPDRGANIDVNTRVSTALSLSPVKIVESFYRPVGTRSTPRRRPPRRANPRADKAAAKPSEVKNKQIEAILKLLHAGAKKILPITLNYSQTSRVGEAAVRGQPGIFYRLGIDSTSTLLVDSLTTGGLDLSRSSSGADFSWKSGISLGKSVNLNLSSVSRVSRSRGRSSTTESVSRSFLVLSDDKDNLGLPLMDWNLRLSGLEKLPILKWVPWTVSLEHSYTGSHVRNIQNQQLPVDSYKRSFQPLVGLTFSFKNGISANLRYSDQLTLNIKDSGDSKEEGNQFSSSINYQRRGGFNIPIPFYGNFKIDNTVNFSLTIEASNSVSFVRVGESAEFVETKFSRNLSIKPYITYTFSKNVSGSFRFGYSERENPITGKTITRDIGFDVNMVIRGS